MMMVPIRAPASSSSSYRHVPVSSVYEYVQGEPFTLMSNPTPTAASASIGRSNMGPPTVTRSETRFITQTSPPQSEIPPRRKRASKPKVKTGCITCKVSESSVLSVPSYLLSSAPHPVMRRIDTPVQLWHDSKRPDHTIY